jgi:hypothetical protein
MSKTIINTTRYWRGPHSFSVPDIVGAVGGGAECTYGFFLWWRYFPCLLHLWIWACWNNWSGASEGAASTVCVFTWLMPFMQTLHIQIDVEDSSSTKLASYFEEVLQFVHTARWGNKHDFTLVEKQNTFASRCDGGGVFIHCKFGSSRSVVCVSIVFINLLPWHESHAVLFFCNPQTCIVAYMMCQLAASPREVLDFIKSKRPEADPNAVRTPSS